MPMGTIHHLGHGSAHSADRLSPVRTLSSQKIPSRRKNCKGLTSGSLGPMSGQRSSILHSYPISPSRTNPLPSSLLKTAKANMSVMDKEPPPEVVELCRKILEDKRKTLKEVQNSYNEKLTELFFLQQSNNMMDYLLWKKKQPDMQLIAFLKSKQLEEKLLERNINDEVKVLMSGTSNVPLSTPIAISTQLPPEVTALSAQLKKRSDNLAEDGCRKVPQGPPSSAQAESRKRSSSQAGLGEPGEERSVKLSLGGVDVTKTESSTALSGSVPTISVIPATPTHMKKSDVEESAPSVTKIAADSSDVKHASGLSTPLRRNVSAPAAGQLLPKTIKSPQYSAALARERQATRQQSLSAVYDYTIGSQEMIVERAKQEAQVMQRIAELRREGLWSAKRLPRVQEPPRHKAHWDYLLEEMQWLAADFAQERRWKKNAARKLVRAVAKYHQEQEARELKAEREEVQRLKKIAGNIAKEIKAFWANIEKVVQYKQQSRLDERRKKALDLQLDFIVGQTEKYSSWLTEGLNTSTAGSSAQGSLVSSPRSEHGKGTDADAEFHPHEDDSDDEETIDVEEKQAANDEESSNVDEIELLQKESELPIEELLSSLQESSEKDRVTPGDQVKQRAADDQPDGSLKDVASADTKNLDSKDDQDFELSADEEEEEVDDDEKTLDEQEEAEGELDHKAELDELAAEGEIPLEELLKQYEGAYAEDFELPDSEEDESEDESSEDFSSEEEVEEEEEEGLTGEESQDELKDVGMEYLINPDKENEDAVEKASKGTSEDSGPNKEITDIAAAAQSLQPTGYTLSDTQVKTKVPFLLHHILREYQHIGLDWLVTMHEKKLNGILADEMGLGKTIQTIALFAHLACEDSCWGPHLIIVPTSVMLNWEMELKKWCPGFKILTYFGTQKERKQKRQGWTKTNAFHVCITSYKLVIQDHQSFRRKKWKYLVLDEAQNIKNFKSQRWQTLLNFSSQRRLLLTGTPLQNNLMELWSLMHFLMPHVFQSHREFKEWFSNPLGGMIEGTQEYNESIVRRLHKVLRPFLLRRLKSQVEKQLPQKYEHVIRCRLSKRQRYLYDDFMGQTKTKETLATGHFMSVINVLMQLRKVCNHPDLFEARPIKSAFVMTGLLYYTASLVHRVLEYDPLKNVSLQALNLCIADLEISLPAYAAHRTCQLQTPRKLIEEIDAAPDQTPRPPRVKVKPGKLYPSSMALQAQKEARASPQVNRPSDRASPSSAAHAHGRGSPTIVRVASPIAKGAPASPGLTQVLVRSTGVNLQTRAPTPPQGTVLGASQILQSHGRPGTPPVTLTAISNPRSPGTLTLLSQNPLPVPSGTPLQQLPGYTGTAAGSATPQLGQQRVLLQQQVSGVGTNGRAQLVTTQPITVQLQPGSSTSTQPTGGRLLAGQIRQLPQGGIVQIIQTSGGQQIIRPVQLTSQSNILNAQRTSSPQTQVVQRPGTPQVVLSHTTAQLQAAQQLHQSIQRQLTAQGISPSQAQAVASQLSKVTAAQSPIQLQQRQILLHQPQSQSQSQSQVQPQQQSQQQPQQHQHPQQQQQQQHPQVLLSAKVSGVSKSPAIQTVTIVSSSSSSRPSSPSVTIVQAPKTVSAANPSSIPSAKTITTTPKVSDVKEEPKECKEVAEKLKRAEKRRKSSPLYLESLDKLKADERKSTLSCIATFNQQRCCAKPVYGQDLFTAVSLYHTSKPGGKGRPFSSGVGMVHCHHSLVGDALRRVEVAYKKTNNLRHLLRTPVERIEELKEVFKRFTFVVPAASALPITMHTSHTPPSIVNRENALRETMTVQLKDKTWCLHPIENHMRMAFPELRLIQYDCGKLQTLDVLLRKLKCDGSRVLIFTQMTKMLDVLERFLNYHGHIYLRLDGTTKVEQRQILMERFNKDPRIFCFILSTRSGGIGVNLTGANAVIFYDSDWNPTMDAQAQDRCHRIGQTRDVHIYRLISEMSIEENILKKSNQKRLLIDVSIEGGNFTTAFFKKHTIREIFDISKDAGELLDAPRAQPPIPELRDKADPSKPAAVEADPDEGKPLLQSELEKALARAEDESDVRAASRAHAEQDAELAEFDESIPYEGEEGKVRDEASKVEMELAQLDEQLTPIERYAVYYLEETIEPITAEQLKEAEEQVEAAKRDWELGRLQALKEQEEREAEFEEDEVLFTYSKEDSENQVHKASRNAKRKDRSRGSVKENGQRGRMSRDGGKTWGSRGGNRSSSGRGGSPPNARERPTRSRSRASNGPSVTEGDFPVRRTRSRASSGSGSDKLPSPRPVDRAGRMAEREKRRDTLGSRVRVRKKSSGDGTPKSPERRIQQRKYGRSDVPRSPLDASAKNLRKSKSPDRGVFSDSERIAQANRATRRRVRSGSVSEDSKVGANLQPTNEVTEETGRPVAETGVTFHSDSMLKSSDLQCTQKLEMKDSISTSRTMTPTSTGESDQNVQREAEKKVRNIFDLVDRTMQIKGRVSTESLSLTETNITVQNKFEKLNTRNLFTDLAKKLRKKSVVDKSVSLEDVDGHSSLVQQPSTTALIDISCSHDDDLKNSNGSVPLENEGHLAEAVKNNVVVTDKDSSEFAQYSCMNPNDLSTDCSSAAPEGGIVGKLILSNEEASINVKRNQEKNAQCEDPPEEQFRHLASMEEQEMHVVCDDIRRETGSNAESTETVLSVGEGAASQIPPGILHEEQSQDVKSNESCKENADDRLPSIIENDLAKESGSSHILLNATADSEPPDKGEQLKALPHVSLDGSDQVDDFENPSPSDVPVLIPEPTVKTQSPQSVGHTSAGKADIVLEAEITIPKLDRINFGENLANLKECEDEPSLDGSPVNSEQQSGPDSLDREASSSLTDGQKMVHFDSEVEDVVALSSPPKPTRSVREILNLALPGERPLNPTINGPSARTRSRNSSDTVRTRSQSKPPSSNLSSVFTPLRTSKSAANPKSKKAVESKSILNSGPKRSPRLSGSDPGSQLRTWKSLRSSAERS